MTVTVPEFISSGAAIAPPEWRSSPGFVPYPEAVRWMEARVAAIAARAAPECIWLLEHPPLFTAGTSAPPDELLDPGGLPVFRSGRGGRYTYHGPGQRVAYTMLDLNRRGRDVRRFVASLEDWLIETLSRLGMHGSRRPEQVGIFAGGAKIASIGIRVRRWVAFHGISLNVAPDLSRFSGIVPCGLKEASVTSLAALGIRTDMRQVDHALHAAFGKVFGDECR